MKKLMITAMALVLSVSLSAQSKLAKNWQSIQKKDIFSHIDVSVTGGTTGIGFDLATPFTKWAQLRMGGVFRWHTSYNATLDVTIPKGLEDDKRVSTMLFSMLGYEPEKSIEMQGTFAMNNFKVLVDFFPIQKHKNFHVTVGAFIGNSDIVNGSNANISVNTLSAMRMYNNVYNTSLSGKFINLSSLNINLDNDMSKKLADKIRAIGAMEIACGTYSHDIIAGEDIYYAYTETDANGNVLHKKNDLRCAKGDVLHKAGETVLLTPDEDNIIQTNATVNSVKPYVGLGYTLPLSKDKRTSISVDAGVIFWGGAPAVTTRISEGNRQYTGVNSEGVSYTAYKETYNTIDLNDDVNDVPGHFGEQIRTAKNYVVYPEVSLRLTQRIW